MATSTTCRRNLAALRAQGWGLLVTPDRPEDWGFQVGIDNGAWGCFQRNIAWTPDRWTALVEQHGQRALFAVAPDIVCGGVDSLEKSKQWLPWLLLKTRTALIAVQNGMTADAIAPLVGPRVGIFVGGDSEWKESSLPVWGRLATASGCYLHVGRVNTARRISLCAMAGAHSFDGTSASKYSATVPMLTRASRQTAMRFDT